MKDSISVSNLENLFFYLNHKGAKFRWKTANLRFSRAGTKAEHFKLAIESTNITHFLSSQPKFKLSVAMMPVSSIISDRPLSKRYGGEPPFDQLGHPTGCFWWWAVLTQLWVELLLNYLELWRTLPQRNRFPCILWNTGKDIDFEWVDQDIYE